MEINDLTPAESRLWRAFASGTDVDFRAGGPTAADSDDPAGGGTWGPERTVRASVLRSLLLDGPREEGRVAALSLAGARVTGRLDLQYATVDHPVRLRHCHFDEAPRFYGARLRELNLSESVLPGLISHAVRVEGVLRLTRARFDGMVRLAGAEITGSLYLEGTRIEAPDTEGPVLQLNQAVLGADLWAPGLSTRGPVRLTGASVTGTVNLRDARLDAAGGTALDAQNLVVGSGVGAACLRARGRVDFRGARVPGTLDLLHASLSSTGGTALRASSCVIGELWLRRGDRIEGALNLRRSQIDLLTLDTGKLPSEVYLGDLTYTALAPHEPAERRLPMLERDGDGFVPYAYEQLTASYRRIGDDDAARLVQLAKQRRRRRTLPWYGRLWGHLQDVAVGYGFRPLRAGGWLLSLLAVGSVAYGLHHPPPLKPAEAPDFNPVFYTLDLLLPVISFGQESAFAPEGGYQTLSYVLILMGWILATTVVAGVTRTVSRQ
ncbi:membrane-associated oxidoreductase [Streptomyces sp. G3]|uniref:membrane-associated oxidoreductase n=1 Tax=unclassified Streptomyces TaxID=2593676 RepID=UPI00203020D5|nr:MULTISPECIES: membrane-associated oxidoreductase [unclassified Streptomyces]MCM1943484.1 membrane-associated oxidoreductase [Streptomyces sp. G3]MDU0257474.1 membrane-associated oxidoreductase [Streptomyces sp. PU10]